MSKAPLAAYPALRMRRLRQADWTRRLVRETVLTPSDLIWSMVVHEGEGTIPVSSMPGTAVAIGANSPRYSTGASGFMSHVSIWLGPPKRKIMIARFARGRAVAAAACRASRSGRPRPSIPSPSPSTNCRRDQSCMVVIVTNRPGSVKR